MYALHDYLVMLWLCHYELFISMLRYRSCNRSLASHGMESRWFLRDREVSIICFTTSLPKRYELRGYEQVQGMENR